MHESPEADAVRKALYVLFARLLAGPLDAELYERMRTQGLDDLASAQGLDLTSDLVDEEDAYASASELEEDYRSIFDEVSLRAGDYAAGTENPEAAITAFLREHALQMDRAAGLPNDHLAVALGIMGALAGGPALAEGAEAPLETPEERQVRARSFLHRHLLPWTQQVLAEVAARASLRFYRGLAAMIAAFLESERRLFEAA